jgi:hypothetical protein
MSAHKPVLSVHPCGLAEVKEAVLAEQERESERRRRAVFAPSF